MKISRFLKIVHDFQTFTWEMQFKLNSLFLTSLCFQFVGISNPLNRNISSEICEFGFGLSNNFYKILKIFIKISTFSKREARVQNQCLLEHQSWDWQEIKLQYYIKPLNVTELVTQMQSINEIKIFTSNIIDLRGGGPFQKHCWSVLLF